MRKIKCYSIRVQSLMPISDKCYKATAFDGSMTLIPISQVFGQDYDVQNSEAYWISEWLLNQKDGFQWSRKKEAFFTEDGRQLPNYTVEKHIPDKIEPKIPEIDESLAR